MQRLTFERSRGKNIGLALIGVALVAASWFTIQKADDSIDRIFGWFGLVFFGLCIVVAVKRALEGGVAFVFDGAGIRTEDDEVGLIPWSDVESCFIISIRGTRLLSLTFREPEMFLARVSVTKRKLAAFNQRMGWGHWSFSFAGVKPGVDEAMRFIRENAPGVSVPIA